MLFLNAEQTNEALPWLELVDALRDGFVKQCNSPLRHQHEFEIPGESPGTLVIMPGWISGEYLGVKQILVIPDNGKRELSSVSANYQLSSAIDGQAVALIDGAALTNRRTAAASALASSYLSRTDSKHLLMVGTGGLARSLIQAHVAARPIEHISVWGRSPSRSKLLVDDMKAIGINTIAIEDLETTAKQADIISCATLADSPLIFGKWLKDGAHLDLVGAFKPSMRECDDFAISRSSVFVDTREGALEEAGDIIQTINAGEFAANDIKADLYQLCSGRHTGRENEREITVFKSVGTALEDLAAAVLAYENTK